MQEHELQHLRHRKDQMSRDDHRSPMRAVDRSTFSGLRYFPPAPELAFDLKVEPADGSTLEIRTSDGSRRRYRRSGRVRFDVDGEQAELVLLSLPAAGERTLWNQPSNNRSAATSARPTGGSDSKISEATVLQPHQRRLGVCRRSAA